MGEIQKRTFGRLGYGVSALGLGCMRLPSTADPKTNLRTVDLEKSYELIRYAADNGISYFDTAFGYHGTTSEAVLGTALEGERRRRVKIATKQPLNVMKDKDNIRRNLENTLTKLKTDYIDIYLLHNVQAGNWDGFKEIGALEVYEQFKAEGLIKAIGFSYHGGYDAFSRVLGEYDWDMCQIQQNLLDIHNEATEQAIKDAGDKGVALVIMEPLRGGGLTNAPAPVKAAYDSYKTRREPVEWAFRHLVNYPQISCILSGMSDLEQLKSNIALFSKPDMTPGCLSAEEIDIIAKARAGYQSIVTIPCTGCGYCMPCPSGVQIPETFAKYNEGMMFGAFDNPKRSYMFTTRFGGDVSHCTKCGACVKKCPQHIDVVSQLQIAHEKLKGWVE